MWNRANQWSTQGIRAHLHMRDAVKCISHFRCIQAVSLSVAKSQEQTVEQTDSNRRTVERSAKTIKRTHKLSIVETRSKRSNTVQSSIHELLKAIKASVVRSLKASEAWNFERLWKVFDDKLLLGFNNNNLPCFVCDLLLPSNSRRCLINREINVVESKRFPVADLLNC